MTDQRIVYLRKERYKHMKYCTSCGHKVGATDRFCSNCGSGLSHVGDSNSSVKSDLKAKNILFDTKKAALNTVKKTKRIVKKLLIPTLSVFIVGGVALTTYSIVKNNQQKKMNAMHEQALQEQEDKQRVKKLEKCVLEHFANAHGNSKKVWGYLKVMCSLRTAEVNKYQIEWGENLELLKNKSADNTILP